MLRLVSLSAVLTAARLLGAFASLLTTLILTHQFGPETAASFAVCTALAATLATLGLSGTQMIAPMITAEYSRNEQYGHLRGFILFAGTTSVALTCFLALILLGTYQIGLLASLGFDLEPPMLLAASAIAVCMTASSFSAGILAGRHKQPRAQLPENLMRPILVLIFIGMLVLFAAGSKLAFLLTLVAVAFGASTLLLTVFLFQEMSSIPVKQRCFDFSRWCRMAPPWLVITLAWDNMIELLLLLAAALMGPTEVLLLYVCFRFRMLFGFGLRSIYSVTQPKIYEAMAGKDKQATRSVIGATNALCMVYSIAAMLFLLLFSDLLLGLFDAEFADQKTLLISICSLMIFRSMFGPGMALLASAKKHFQTAVVLLFSLLFALVLAPLLFQFIGIIGFGIAYTATNAGASVALWWFARRETGIDCGIWDAGFRHAKALIFMNRTSVSPTESFYWEHGFSDSFSSTTRTKLKGLNKGLRDDDAQACD